MWLKLSEEKCLRVGKLKNKMMEEKLRVLDLMRMKRNQEEKGGPDLDAGIGAVHESCP